MDTKLEQYAIQNFDHKFVKMNTNGDSLWTKVYLDKKCIVCINPMNGFVIAALKDIDYEIKLPNYLPTYDANFNTFK